MYHDPVLLEESISALNISAKGVFVDVTFGGGGHSREILRRLGSEGKLYAFDQDKDAVENEIGDNRFKLIKQNFRYIRQFLRFYGEVHIDGVLMDLGVSSHQFDEGSRGFSIRFDGPLDMRMNTSSSVSAKDIVNRYSGEKLLEVLQQYGEVVGAKKVVRGILEGRERGDIETTGQLVDIVGGLFPGKVKNKSLAQVFQAIRIEVNDELGALKECVRDAGELLRPGGIMSVITYHSLEDRLVKNYMKTGNFSGELIKDFYGNKIVPMKAINKKPILPSQEELARNNRARSAKLRVAEKL